MLKLAYYNFLEAFAKTKHYKVSYSQDAKGLPSFELLPDEFGEEILSEVASGEIHPIVVSPEFIQKHELFADRYDKMLNKYRDVANLPFEIPMPFDSVWVEFLPEQSIGMNPMLLMPLHQLGPNAKQQIFGYILRRKIVENEIVYRITAFVPIVDRSGVPHEVWTITESISKSEYEQARLQKDGGITSFRMLWHHQLFDILNCMCSEKQVGLDKPKTQIRVGKGKLRQLIKIKNIVYVIPSSERAAFNKKHGTAVDWTHRWEVRGHWRKVERIGKDPEGNYCIPGMTWVRPSVKGPEKAPLVHKTRHILPAKEVTTEVTES